MKTLDEHNEAVKAARKARDCEKRRAGVACPKCGKEMLYKKSEGTVADFLNRNRENSSRAVECECGHTGYRLEWKTE